MKRYNVIFTEKTKEYCLLITGHRMPRMVMVDSLQPHFLTDTFAKVSCQMNIIQINKGSITNFSRGIIDKPLLTDPRPQY